MQRRSKRGNGLQIDMSSGIRTSATCRSSSSLIITASLAPVTRLPFPFLLFCLWPKPLPYQMSEMVPRIRRWTPCPEKNEGKGGRRRSTKIYPSIKKVTTAHSLLTASHVALCCHRRRNRLVCASLLILDQGSQVTVILVQETGTAAKLLPLTFFLPPALRAVQFPDFRTETGEREIHSILVLCAQTFFSRNDYCIPSVLPFPHFLSASLSLSLSFLSALHQRNCPSRCTLSHSLFDAHTHTKSLTC